MTDSKSTFTVVDNYINGEYVAPVGGKYMDVDTPHTGEKIGKVALSNDEDVKLAVEAATAAFTKWSGMTIKQRCAILIRFHQLMIEHEKELAGLINLEHGKNIPESVAEVQKGNETVEWAMSMPQLFQGKILEVSRGVTCHDSRRPLGIVVSIVPFNFPVMVPMWTIPIALACGNVMILKPSEKVPLTMHRVAKLFKEAGLPDGVFNIINGTADAVNGLIDNPKVKAVTFVGSTKIAELVSKRGTALNKRVLALGGAKNHLVTLDDCNVDMAAADIVASFTGCTGQRCMAASVLLTVGDQPAMLKAIVSKAKEITAGKNARQCGPLIDQAAVDRVNRYIEQSLKSGAELLLDGRSWTSEHKTGFWMGPSVLLHKNPADAALHDEIFGPVLSILKVDSKEAAIEIENANPYGNAAAIYTTVGENAEWFCQRFSAGMIGINIGVPVPREPFSFGGINVSKFGSHDITGDGAMEFFTNRIKVTTKWTPPPNRTWMD